MGGQTAVVGKVSEEEKKGHNYWESKSSECQHFESGPRLPRCR